MAGRRAPAQTPDAWRKAKAQTTSDFRSESVWFEKRELRRHPGLGAESRARVRNNPRGVGAQSIPGTQAPEESAFLPPRSEASGAPERPQPRAALLLRYERRRCQLRPAPHPLARGKIRSLNQSWESQSSLHLSILVRLCRP